MSASDRPDEFLSLAAAAAERGVTHWFLRDAIAENRLPAYRASRKCIRVRRSDVAALFVPMNDAARDALAAEAGASA
ncbi:MAG: hypothetical protein KDB60_07545 [Propionibacteriaceae bacterium]|nr:hypothetical protein [Propionibacteriaceae bacterium]